MPRKKRHKPEEIVAKLRQADVLISQGQSVAGGACGERRDEWKEPREIHPAPNDPVRS